MFQSKQVISTITTEKKKITIIIKKIIVKHTMLRTIIHTEAEMLKSCFKNTILQL